jgi:hypothetical protein
LRHTELIAPRSDVFDDGVRVNEIEAKVAKAAEIASIAYYTGKPLVGHRFCI